jgi:energy-converting hydrogenase A subunit P
VPRPQAASLPAESVGCSSSQEIDAAACTACMLCVTSCPTGALQAPRLHQEIRFEARRCVNCGLCNDVCEAKAIKSAPELNVGEFLAPTPKVLVRFKMAQCGECGAPVRAEGGGEEVRCEACKSQHAEARSLWGHE